MLPTSALYRSRGRSRLRSWTVRRWVIEWPPTYLFTFIFTCVHGLCEGLRTRRWVIVRKPRLAIHFKFTFLFNLNLNKYHVLVHPSILEGKTYSNTRFVLAKNLDIFGQLNSSHHSARKLLCSQKRRLRNMSAIIGLNCSAVKCDACVDDTAAA